MPPTLVHGTELVLTIMPVALDYLPHCLLLLFSSFGAAVMYVCINIYIRTLENLRLHTPMPPLPQLQRVGGFWLSLDM
jgi:hypothetical protein